MRKVASIKVIIVTRNKLRKQIKQKSVKPRNQKNDVDLFGIVCGRFTWTLKNRKAKFMNKGKKSSDNASKSLSLLQLDNFVGSNIKSIVTIVSGFIDLLYFLHKENDLTFSAVRKGQVCVAEKLIMKFGITKGGMKTYENYRQDMVRLISFLSIKLRYRGNYIC